MPTCPDDEKLVEELEEAVAERDAVVAEVAALKARAAATGFSCASCGVEYRGSHQCAGARVFEPSTPYVLPVEKRVRATWDQYFMRIAREVAQRSTCDRKHVGAVVVRDRSILATGYNGSVRGQLHCDDAGHLMADGHCVRTVHAEQNAVAQAARHGHALGGADAYATSYPCLGCFKLLANAGIARILYEDAYRPDEAIARLRAESVAAAGSVLSLPLVVRVEP